MYKYKYSHYLSQYCVDAHLSAVTASSLHEYDATSLAHLSLGSFAHSSLQNLLSSINLDGNWWCTDFSPENFNLTQVCATQGHSEGCAEITCL